SGESCLNKEGSPSVIISPFTSVILKNGLIDNYPVDIIRKSLENGLVVITHGDVCFDIEKTASILSGDTIAVHLVKKLNAANIFIGTDV
ncbi:MAG: hypothetical protein ACFFFK_12950, partial [Candidatus Thorarchaeota archaeon]